MGVCSVKSVRVIVCGGACELNSPLQFLWTRTEAARSSLDAQVSKLEMSGLRSKPLDLEGLEKNYKVSKCSIAHAETIDSGSDPLICESRPWICFTHQINGMRRVQVR